MKKIIIIFSLFIGVLNAGNQFLKNQNIIDIGHSQESSEIEVPKQKIVREPSTLVTVENRITYQERVQSEIYDCETDFLGVETCAVERNVCPSSEEHTGSQSVPHHVVKQYIKTCPQNTIKENGKCYVDANNDGIKDYSFYAKAMRVVWNSYRIRGSEFVMEEGNLTIPPNGTISVKHKSPNACDDDNNHLVIKIDDVVKFDKWCGASKSLAETEIYRNNTSVDQKVSYYYFDGHSGSYSHWDNSTFTEYTTIPMGTFYTDYNTEVVGDITYYYIPLECPFDSIEQPDGTCKMEYNWYSYVCPSDVNSYGNTWQPINPGSDCGFASCANSSIPPQNNCVRVNYSCPIDPDMKCGKTSNDTGVCMDGFVWNNTRCERIESYCGESIYNAALDVCQNVNTYAKKCSNANESYNLITNKCESTARACPHGVYSKTYDSCIMDVVTACSDSGYIYNPITDLCENPNLPLCESQYDFSSTNNKCVGRMTVCLVGQTYNEITKKCEKNLCGYLNTTDSGSRCETNSLCDGTITPAGTCIPNTIIQ